MFFRLSEPLANLIFSVGNFSLIFGAVFVLLGSILVPWSAGEKDRYSNEKIAEARKVGSVADEKAGLANKQAGLANERAALLEKEAALSRERSLQLESQIEVERSGRIALAGDVTKLKPRELSATNSSKLISALQALNLGHMTIVVSYDMACSDCNHFASDIIATLSQVAGLQTTGGSFMGSAYISPKGMKFASNDNSLALSFQKAFHAAEVDGDVGTIPGNQPSLGPIEIFVSAKVRG